MLRQLASKRFNFQVPTLLPSLKGGASSAKLASGTEACLFKCIPGSGPQLTGARSIGKSTAELVAGMADIKVELPLPNPLYRNIYEAHHKITRDLFFKQVADKVRRWPLAQLPSGTQQSNPSLFADVLRLFERALGRCSTPCASPRTTWCGRCSRRSRPWSASTINDKHKRWPPPEPRRDLLSKH